jgi:hypothetical protein
VLKHTKSGVMYVFSSAPNTDFLLYLTKLKHRTPHRTYSLIMSLLASHVGKEDMVC